MQKKYYTVTAVTRSRSFTGSNKSKPVVTKKAAEGKLLIDIHFLYLLSLSVFNLSSFFERL